jgi:hypothetical protein
MPDDPLTLVFDLAQKAVSTQLDEWQALRGRVATVATLGPAAAAVVVANTTRRVDALAIAALVFLALGVSAGIYALLPRPFGSGVNSDGMQELADGGADVATLREVAATLLRQAVHKNAFVLRRVQMLFIAATMSLLLSVLLWAVHAALGRVVH